MSAIEEFNFDANRAAVGAGFKGGDFFTKPAPLPTMTFAGCPKEVEEKFEAMPVPSGTPTDPWGSRRNK